MKLLSVNDLSLQNEGYFAFKHVAFSLVQNEIIGIDGDNGSGKSQLLEAIANNFVSDSGTIEYTPGVRIGYLPQVNPEEIDQTVASYLEDIRQLSKDLAVRKEQLKGMITFLGISPYLNRSVRQLSTGLKRQVDFLAAVCGHPNVLLLDEPFAFQTRESIKKMLELINDLKDNGAGVIIACTEFGDDIKKVIDTEYCFSGGILKENTQENIKQCQLIFSVYPNSIAITHDIEQYMVENVNNRIEMQVPLRIKDSIIKEMTQLNYRFEEVKNIES